MLKFRDIINFIKECNECQIKELKKKIFVFVEADTFSFSYPNVKYTCIEADENTPIGYLQAYERTSLGESLRGYSFVGYAKDQSKEECITVIEDFYENDGKLYRN